MTMSSICHHRADGQPLYAVIGLSALKSLDAAKILQLDKMGIRSLADLLHYRHIHSARLIVTAARGAIAHELNLAGIVESEHRDLPPQTLVTSNVTILDGLGDVTADALLTGFQVTTIAELAEFEPFLEAQVFLRPERDLFSEPASAPDELMPKAIGSVASSACYSSFVREHTHRFEQLTIGIDKNREHFIDPRIALLFLADSEVEFRLGYVVKTKQRWINMGTNLGEILHSLSLAPGESRNIAIVDWKRSVLASRDEQGKITETLNSTLVHKRALDEVTRSVACEHQSGGTEIGAATVATGIGGVAAGAGVGAVAGAIAAAIPGSVIGAVVGSVVPGVGTAAGAGVGAGAGVALGAVAGGAVGAVTALGGVMSANGQLGVIQTDSSGERRILGEIAQNITDTTVQKSSAIRSLWSTVVLNEEQAETETVKTLNVTNYNHSHALTVQYYEVLQHYHVEIKPVEMEPLLFLPFKPLAFDLDLILTYWDVLKQGIPDENLVQRFETTIGMRTGSTSSRESEGVLQKDLRLFRLTVRVTGHQTPWPSDTEWIPRYSRMHDVHLCIKAASAESDIDGKVPSDSGNIFFTFNFASNLSQIDDMPNVDELSGIIVSKGTHDPIPIHVEITGNVVTPEGKAWEVFTEVNRDLLQKEFISIPIRTLLTGQPTASDADSLTVVSHSAVDQVVRFVNERRYAFTRLLLHFVEREQLVDLIEALVIAAPFDEDRLVMGVQSTLADILGRQATPEHAKRVVTALGLAPYSSPVGWDRVKGVLSAQGLDRIDEGQFRRILDGLGLALPRDKDISRNVLREIYDRLLDSPGARLERKTLGSIVKSFPRRGTITMPITDLIEPEPIAITENTLVFRMKHLSDEAPLRKVELGDPFYCLLDTANYAQTITAELDNEQTPEERQRARSRTDDAYLPTSGVFAEAILGRSNASEKIDLTRFYNWQDSPIPHLAPAIQPLALGSRYQPVEGLEPTEFTNVLNLVNPPALPDPVGLAASLAAIQNGAMFRDMSGRETLGAVLANLSQLASQTANIAGKMTGDTAAQTLQSATRLGSQVMSAAENLASSALTSESSVGGVLNQLDKMKDQLDGAGQPAGRAIAEPLSVPESMSPTSAPPEAGLSPNEIDEARLRALGVGGARTGGTTAGSEGVLLASSGSNHVRLPRYFVRQSVGSGGANDRDDVERTRKRFEDLGFDWLGVTAAGAPNNDFIDIIKLFQHIIHGRAGDPSGRDGLIEPEKETERWLQASNAPHWESLENGSAAVGFVYNAGGTGDDRYGTDWLLQTIRDAGARYLTSLGGALGDRVAINVHELSAQHAGPSGHASSHRTGVNVDVRLPRNDGPNGGDNSTNVGGITHASPEYDQDATRRILQSFRAQPLVARVKFNDPVLTAEGLCTAEDNHDNHIHIRIEPPAIGDVETNIFYLPPGTAMA